MLVSKCPSSVLGVLESYLGIGNFTQRHSILVWLWRYRPAYKAPHGPHLHVCLLTYKHFLSLLEMWMFFSNKALANIRAPFHRGLRLISSLLNTRFAILLRLISIVQLIITHCETGPWGVAIERGGVGLRAGDTCPHKFPVPQVPPPTNHALMWTKWAEKTLYPPQRPSGAPPPPPRQILATCLPLAETLYLELVLCKKWETQETVI